MCARMLRHFPSTTNHEVCFFCALGSSMRAVGLQSAGRLFPCLVAKADRHLTAIVPKPVDPSVAAGLGLRGSEQAHGPISYESLKCSKMKTVEGPLTRIGSLRMVAEDPAARDPPDGSFSFIPEKGGQAKNQLRNPTSNENQIFRISRARICF